MRLRPLRGLRQPASRTPWRDANWCAVDVELTGLDPRDGELIAIGAVPVQGGRLILGDARYTLVRPERPPARDAVLVHKLRVVDLADAPALDEATGLLLDALAGRVPIFHTAAVERLFLGRALARRGVRLPRGADTEAIGRRWLRQRDGAGPERLSLGRLATLLGQSAEPPHHALGDAITTAQAFLALASHLDATEPQTVGSLVHVPDAHLGARGFGPG